MGPKAINFELTQSLIVKLNVTHYSRIARLTS